MTRAPTLLMIVSDKWKGLGAATLSGVTVLREGRDTYDPAAIDYVMGFVPPPGKLKSLPNLKAAFSLGAGVDGFLSDPDYPRHVPLVRFVDDTLSNEMAQYVLLQVLSHHRRQRFFAAAQREGQWRQATLERRTEDTRIGLLGLGEIGRVCARRLIELGFAVASFSRTRHDLPGLKSFAGTGEWQAFLGRSDILVCLASLTRETRGILNAAAFAALPPGAFVINAARGAHLIEADLLEALDRGHLAGAALDVFQEEPLPPQSPLWAHEKVTITPHIAAVSQPAVVMAYLRDGIAAFERGQTPPNLVDLGNAY